MVMGSEITIRPAEPTEAAAIGELTERVYRVGGHTDDAYGAVLADADSRIRDAVVLVAILADDLAGTLTLATHGTPYAEICRPDELEVRMLAVADGARRRGLAAALMDEAEDHARSLGLAGVVLSTQPEMAAAHELYRRRGYVHQARRDWLVDGFTLLAYRLDLAARPPEPS